MSLNSSKNAILLVAALIGLAGATALVSGYVERPGQAAQVTATEGGCADCPLQGTDECCRATCEPGCEDGCCNCCGSAGCVSPCGTSACGAKAQSECGAGGCLLTQ
jgi:hypothetical protein